jgi:hypothetical protein
MKYKYRELITYCNQNKITLVDDYREKEINRESYIEAKCI